MAGGGEGSNSSTTSRGGATDNVVCDCGRVAVVRTVKSDPNVGLKFHGCPLWPNTNCNFFKWIEERKHLGDDGVDELRFQMFEKDTALCQLEYEKQMVDEKNRKLMSKIENLEEQLKEMKLELRQTRIELMKTSRTEKSLSITLMFSWFVFGLILVFLLGKVM